MEKIIKAMKEKFSDYDENMVEAVTKMVTEINEQSFNMDEEAISKAVEKQLEKHLNSGESMITKMLGGNQEEVSKKEKKIKKELIQKYYINGKASFTPEESKMLSTPVHSKAMSSMDFATGGIFAQDDMLEEVQKDYIEYSPVRQLFGIRQTTDKRVTFTRRPESGVLKAYHTGELAEMSESGLKYKKGEINLHKLTAVVGVSREDIQYSKTVDLANEIQNECIEQLAVTEADDVINGDGINGCRGILKHPEVIASMIPTAGAAPSYKDVVKLFNTLKPIYRRNGVFFANRAMIELIATLEDGSQRPIFFANGQFPNKILEDGIRGEVAGYLMGKPLYDFPDMPDTVTVGGTPLLAFGDFKKGYLIGDFTELFMLRDEFSQSSQGIIKYQFEKFVGGDVILPEAIKVLKLKV